MDELTSQQRKCEKKRPARPPPPRVMQAVNNLPSTVLKHFEELSDFRVQRVRWFYHQDKKWSPFCGQDSLKIEQCFRYQTRKDTKTSPDLNKVCSVLGGLYDVDVVNQICKPVYWKG